MLPIIRLVNTDTLVQNKLLPEPRVENYSSSLTYLIPSMTTFSGSFLGMIQRLQTTASHLRDALRVLDSQRAPLPALSLFSQTHNAYDNRRPVSIAGNTIEGVSAKRLRYSWGLPTVGAYRHGATWKGRFDLNSFQRLMECIADENPADRRSALPRAYWQTYDTALSLNVPSMIVQWIIKHEPHFLPVVNLVRSYNDPTFTLYLLVSLTKVLIKLTPQKVVDDLHQLREVARELSGDPVRINILAVTRMPYLFDVPTREIITKYDYVYPVIWGMSQGDTPYTTHFYSAAEYVLACLTYTLEWWLSAINEVIKEPASTHAPTTESWLERLNEPNAAICEVHRSRAGQAISQLKALAKLFNAENDPATQAAIDHINAMRMALKERIKHP